MEIPSQKGANFAYIQSFTTTVGKPKYNETIK